MATARQEASCQVEDSMNRSISCQIARNDPCTSETAPTTCSVSAYAITASNALQYSPITPERKSPCRCDHDDNFDCVPFSFDRPAATDLTQTRRGDTDNKQASQGRQYPFLLPNHTTNKARAGDNELVGDSGPPNTPFPPLCHHQQRFKVVNSSLSSPTFNNPGLSLLLGLQPLDFLIFLYDLGFQLQQLGLGLLKLRVPIPQDFSQIGFREPGVR